MTRTPCTAKVGPLGGGHTHTCERDIHPITSAAHDCPCGEIWFDQATGERIGALIEDKMAEDAA